MLLAKAFHWLLDRQLPLKVEGAGTLDCRLYRQSGPRGFDRIILHLMNLTGCDGPPGSLSFVPPIGPIRISIRQDLIGADILPGFRMAEARVSGQKTPCTLENEWITCSLEQVREHEMLVWQSESF